MIEKDLLSIFPYITSQKVLTGKWSLYILYILSDGPIRFNELLRHMPEEMTHTTLSRQLKALETEKLIIRKEYDEVTPRVEYTLSEIGAKFQNVLDELNKWGQEYVKFIEEDN